MRNELATEFGGISKVQEIRDNNIGQITLLDKVIQ